MRRAVVLGGKEAVANSSMVRLKSKGAWFRIQAHASLTMVCHSMSGASQRGTGPTRWRNYSGPEGLATTTRLLEPDASPPRGLRCNVGEADDGIHLSGRPQREPLAQPEAGPELFGPSAQSLPAILGSQCPLPQRPTKVIRRRAHSPRHVGHATPLWGLRGNVWGVGGGPEAEVLRERGEHGQGPGLGQLLPQSGAFR